MTSVNMMIQKQQLVKTKQLAELEDQETHLERMEPKGLGKIRMENSVKKLNIVYKLLTCQ